MLEMHAASRKSSTARRSHFGLGAGARISRTRHPVKPACAVSSKNDAPSCQPLGLAEVLAKWAPVMDKPRSARSLEVWEDLVTLPVESWNWQRHAKEHLLHHCGHFRTSTKGHREGCGSPRRRQKRRTRATARDVVPDLWDTRVRSGGQWPRFGLEVALAGAEASTLVIAWHVESQAVLETAKKQLMAPTGKGTPNVKSENLFGSKVETGSRP